MKPNILGVVMIAAGLFWFAVAVLLFTGLTFSSAVRTVLVGSILVGGIIVIAASLVDPKEPRQ